MKVFITLLLIVTVGLGIWGNSQSSAKAKAIKDLSAANKSIQTISAEKKSISASQLAQSLEIKELKTKIQKLEASKVILAKEVEIHKKIINQSKDKNKTIKKVASNKKQKIKNKAVKKTVVSLATYRKISSLNQKIEILNNEIERYKKKAVNPKTFGIKKKKKGWYYKLNAHAKRIRPISSLPKKKKGIKYVYYSDAEIKAKLKVKYLAMVKKFESEKEILVKELAKLKG